MAKKLPPWAALKLHYPADGAKNVAQLIGGKVEFNYDIGVFTNFCAIRVSRALNLAGQPVPYIKDTKPNGNAVVQVSSGANGLWHIFRVRVLLRYLKKTYGAPLELRPKDHRSALHGKRGILVYHVSQWSDATGHADLWEDHKCLWNEYESEADKISFWPAS